MKRAHVIGAVVTLLVAASCSGDDDAATTSATTAATVVTSTTLSPSVDADPFDDWTRIEASEDLVDPHVSEVQELVVDPGDPQTVLVRFIGGVDGCYGADATVERQTDREVRIRLETGTVPDSAGCEDIGLPQELAVTLDAPVGARQLVAEPSR